MRAVIADEGPGLQFDSGTDTQIDVIVFNNNILRDNCCLSSLDQKARSFASHAFSDPLGCVTSSLNVVANPTQSPAPSTWAQSFARLVAGAFAVALAPAFLVGCSDAGDDESTREQAVRGRWEIPGDVRATGSAARVHYDDAPAWNPNRCAGHLTEGAQDVGEYLMAKFGQVKSIGGYACRQNTANGGRMSVHGTGRALDVFIPLKDGRANANAGDPVANWLVQNAADIGVQLIIWNRTSWMANGSGDRQYSGPHPHHDHIHVELNLRASSRQTPFFTGPHPAPTQTSADAGVPVPVVFDAGAAPSSLKADAAAPPAVTPDAAAAAPPPAPVEPAPVAPAIVPEEEHVHDDDDGPGEEDSTGLGVREANNITAVGGEAEEGQIQGCMAAPAPAKVPTAPVLGVLIGLSLVVARRRQR